ncbi:hypothetical protein IFR09_06305 [Pseudomonas syringae]|nr:hypothetical protein [Pseudomonas syringae]MBD8789344.1 hypothetical protein [Pseudomonas syringae]MBD8800232.1 hypothetical protein [Pseudomonas syringae]MBD8810772.1 hypothetical protein [Pseudomonas syringae]
MTLYEIVFSGQVVEGARPDTVKANLARLFQADAQRMELLFSGRRLVLKNKLDATAAEKYRSTLERAGAVVEVLDMHPHIEEVELAPPPDAPTWLKKARPADGRLQVVPRDNYMAAFVTVDAPDLSLAEVGSPMQDLKPAPPAPRLDLTGLSLAPAGSDMGQAKGPPAGPPPDTSHLKLS